jgi:hypothetical protein
MTDDPSGSEIDVRASDADREATMTRLRDAAAEGRLTLDELAQRIEAADGAGTRGELARLEADLPSVPTSRVAATPAPRRLFGILGGDTLSGPFELSGECRVINVMGGADLDLTHAVLTEGEVTVRVFSLMGGSNIIVPDGVHVEHSGIGVLGWDKVEQPAGADALPPGAPVVRIRSISIMGGNDVKRSAPRPWVWPWQRRRRGLPSG